MTPTALSKPVRRIVLLHYIGAGLAMASAIYAETWGTSDLSEYTPAIVLMFLAHLACVWGARQRRKWAWVTTVVLAALHAFSLIGLPLAFFFFGWLWTPETLEHFNIQLPRAAARGGAT
jgi:hypothetical protein